MTVPVNNALKILAFDTSSRRGSIALLEGSELRAELKLHHLQNHSANLIRSIDFLLHGLDWTLQDLSLVAVGTGPGSFTGIRIGIATGLGVAQSLSIPFAGISGLEALACQAAFLDGCVGVLMNAHREQVYYAEYCKSGGRIRMSKKPSLMFVSELQRFIKNRHMHIIGDPGLCLVETSKHSKTDWPRSVETDLYLAAHIGRRAAAVRRRWRSGGFIQCEPLYIRPPDALKNRRRGH
jgi:tRNA threonylcarbamoyl adenosine modification protein YeaZ